MFARKQQLVKLSKRRRLITYPNRKRSRILHFAVPCFAGQYTTVPPGDPHIHQTIVCLLDHIGAEPACGRTTYVPEDDNDKDIVNAM